MGVTMLSTWVCSSYLGLRPSELLSFAAADGWCNPDQAVADHCFGDFALVDHLFQAGGDPWNDPATAYLASWPATAWFPALWMRQLGQLTGVPLLGTVAFLVIAVASMLVPAIWLAARQRPHRWLGTILAVATTTACLTSFDRGNPVVFTVPLLLAAALAFTRERWLLFALLVAGACLLKPQLVLLFVLLLTRKRFRYALIGGATAAAGTVLGFLCFPQYFPANLLGWLKSIQQRAGDYQSLDTVFPYNISVGRSALTLLDCVNFRGWTSATTQAWVPTTLSSASWVFTVVILAVVAVTIWVLGPRLAPAHAFTLAVLAAVFTSGTVYLYYLAFLLPSLVLSFAGFGEPDQPGALRRSVWLLSLLMAPILIAVPAQWFDIKAVPTASVGLWQVLTGPALLLYLAWLLIEAWLLLPRRRSRAAVQLPAER